MCFLRYCSYVSTFTISLLSIAAFAPVHAEEMRIDGPPHVSIAMRLVEPEGEAVPTKCYRIEPETSEDSEEEIDLTPIWTRLVLKQEANTCSHSVWDPRATWNAWEAAMRPIIESDSEKTSSTEKQLWLSGEMLELRRQIEMARIAQIKKPTPKSFSTSAEEPHTAHVYAWRSAAPQQMALEFPPSAEIPRSPNARKKISFVLPNPIPSSFSQTPTAQSTEKSIDEIERELNDLGIYLQREWIQSPAPGEGSPAAIASDREPFPQEIAPSGTVTTNLLPKSAPMYSSVPQAVSSAIAYTNPYCPQVGSSYAPRFPHAAPAAYTAPNTFSGTPTVKNQKEATLRDTAWELDQLAQRLESEHLYQQADEVRETAQKLRVSAREMGGEARIVIGH